MNYKITPLPWKVGADGIWKGSIYGPDGVIIAAIAQCYPNDEANAAYIVTACNAHPKLVEALKVLWEASDLAGNVSEDAMQRAVNALRDAGVEL